MVTAQSFGTADSFVKSHRVKVTPRVLVPRTPASFAEWERQGQVRPEGREQHTRQCHAQCGRETPGTLPSAVRKPSAGWGVPVCTALPTLTGRLCPRTDGVLAEAGSRLLKELSDLRGLSLDLLLTRPPGAGWGAGSGGPAPQGHATLGDLQLPTPLEVGVSAYPAGTIQRESGGDSVTGTRGQPDSGGRRW